MNRVRVDVPEVRGDTLVGDVAATGAVRRFFSGKPFRATYSASIEDLPEHLRPIPVLAHVCPVAWATGADVVVETADAYFLDALRRIRSTLLEMYPEFMVGGAIHCSTPVTDERSPGEGDGTGVLFTGGVDSTATYVRHREADPTLISVRGWVIGDDGELWERTRSYVDSFADERGLETRFVESNMLSFLSMPLLQAHFQQYLDGAWYSSVGHGLGLLALCAPLAHVDDVGRLHIAASHTAEWDRPWGSHPEIDDEVAWTGTTSSHDGYDLTRQDKLDLIAEYAETHAPRLPLRTCVYDETAGNCNECEKCYRTMIGLLLAGRDPNHHGYSFDAGTFDRIRRQFEGGDAYFSPTTMFHWGVLQDAARDRTIEEYDGGAAFREWLLEQDFAAYVDRSERSRQHRFLQWVARHTPTSVYGALYPVYRTVAGSPH